MEEQTYIHEVVVVGSGLAGAQACQTLLERGKRVTLLDVGFTDDKPRTPFPPNDFETIRTTSERQQELFLGNDFEGIPWGAMKAGAQLTPQRQYVMRGVGDWLRVASDTFFPFESLAYGGLGNAWGAGCYMFSNAEFGKMGFRRDDFLEGYQTVADRVGISASMDDAAPFTVAGLDRLMAPVEAEPRMTNILEAYRRKKSSINPKGFYLGQPALAVITANKDKREAFAYEDMEFWHDDRQSVYRPWITVNALKAHPNFSMITGKLVVSFEEEGELVHVKAIDVNTKQPETFTTRQLLLCPGVLGSARIALRSAPTGQHLPILCNPYSYVPMLNWRELGKAMPKLRSGMGQLTLFHDADGSNTDVAMAAMFTYRSLLLFRLLKESPFNFSDGRALMQYLLSAMAIAGIHHPDAGNEARKLWLEAALDSPTGDVLRVEHALTKEEHHHRSTREKAFFKVFRQLGYMPLKRIDPGMGSSIHYAGTLPVSSTEKAFHTAPNGKLHGTRNVWIGDASSFRYLPAKGISFTIMANAHRVACQMGKV